MIVPILGTGKNQAGYTLLEVLAVLILIGLIYTLAFPNFFKGEEKLAVEKIGDLIQNDLERLREETTIGKSNETVSLEAHGYQFRMGNVPIRRDFAPYHFRWTGSNGLPEAGDATVETQPSNTEIVFNADGSCTGKVLDWETTRFRGTMQLKMDGTMEWKYEAKR